MNSCGQTLQSARFMTVGFKGIDYISEVSSHHSSIIKNIIVVPSLISIVF